MGERPKVPDPRHRKTVMIGAVVLLRPLCVRARSTTGGDGLCTEHRLSDDETAPVVPPSYGAGINDSLVKVRQTILSGVAPPGSRKQPTR